MQQFMYIKTLLSSRSVCVHLFVYIVTNRKGLISTESTHTSLTCDIFSVSWFFMTLSLVVLTLNLLAPTTVGARINP